MKLGGNRPPGDNPLLFSISGTGSLNMPSRIDEAGHYPVAEHWGESQNVQFSSVGRVAVLQPIQSEGQGFEPVFGRY